MAMLLASLRRQHANLDEATRREQIALRRDGGQTVAPWTRARSRGRARKHADGRHRRPKFFKILSIRFESVRDFVSVHVSKPELGFARLYVQLIPNFGSVQK